MAELDEADREMDLLQIQVTLLTLQHMELKEKASESEKKASDLQAKLEKMATDGDELVRAELNATFIELNATPGHRASGLAAATPLPSRRELRKKLAATPPPARRKSWPEFFSPSTAEMRARGFTEELIDSKVALKAGNEALELLRDAGMVPAGGGRRPVTTADLEARKDTVMKEVIAGRKNKRDKDKELKQAAASRSRVAKLAAAFE